MSDTDRILIGTEWIKVAAKHHGQKGRIDKVGPRGPRMRLIDLPTAARHGSHSSGQPMYQRLDWWELGNNWQPDNKQSQKQYDLWSAAVAVEAAQAMVAREKIELNSIMESHEEQPAIVDVVCKSVYHNPKNGSVPVVEAYQTRTGNWVCLGCKAKREMYQTNYAAKMREAKEQKNHKPERPPVDYVPTPLEIRTDIEILPQWRVTVVQPQIHTVYAKDFLDAATQVSELGEIIRVERV